MDHGLSPVQRRKSGRKATHSKRPEAASAPSTSHGCCDPGGKRSSRMRKIPGAHTLFLLCVFAYSWGFLNELVGAPYDRRAPLAHRSPASGAFIAGRDPSSSIRANTARFDKYCFTWSRYSVLRYSVNASTNSALIIHAPELGMARTVLESSSTPNLDASWGPVLLNSNQKGPQSSVPQSENVLTTPVNPSSRS